MTVPARDSAPASTGDSNTYQTFLSVRTDGDLIKRVEEQFEDWLRKKNWDPPTEETGYHRGPENRELLVLHRPSKAGRDFRARLREPKSNGTWTTNLTVHAAGDDDSWVGLWVGNSEGRFVSVPRLAGFLVDALEARDGDIWLSSKPRVIHLSGVEEFAEELGHIERKGLYFVAGTADDPDLPFGEFRARVTRWTRETVGLAHVAVLDPAATAAFNEIMGPHHGAPPWTIRTFRPDVDPAVDSDGRRHRILGPGRLRTESDGVVRRLLGRVARRHAADQPRPQRFVAVDQALTRLEDRLILEALYAEPTVVEPPTPEVPEVEDRVEPDVDRLADDAAAYLAQIDQVKRSLGIVDLSAQVLDEVAQLIARGRRNDEAFSRLSRQLEERRQAIEELQDEVQYFKELSAEHEFDLADAALDQARVSDENRWLRNHLRSLQDYETAAAALPSALATDYPNSFVDLADRLQGATLDDVVFTGDLKTVRSLEEHDTWGRIVQVAWDALLALADYVRARNDGLCAYGVKYYLENTPHGFRTVPPKKFAEKESGRTMQAWGNQREFPVPREVDATRRSVMEAHFKLGRAGMVSPRLYYLDDWTRSKKVYVGYIGGHLRNTQTN